MQLTAQLSKCIHCDRDLLSSHPYPVCRQCAHIHSPSQARRAHRNHWALLHEYAVANEANWDPSAATAFVDHWERTIPNYTCDCRRRWRELGWQFDTSNPRAFFASGHGAHATVSRSLTPAGPDISLAQAYGFWRRSGSYQTTVPSAPPAVDVVIPFWSGDSQFVAECLRSILDQRHVTTMVHVVADGCEFPDLPAAGPNVLYYRTPGGWGPYRITNGLVRAGQLRTQYIAVQDADDTSHPDRLWRQIATMQQFGYEQTSGTAHNFADSSYRGDRHRVEPRIQPWTVYSSCPMGRMVNTNRLITRDLFTRVGGFADMVCSGDFEFDNRTLHLPLADSIPTFGADDVITERRLHSLSLTNGPEYSRGAPKRQSDLHRVMQNLATIRSSPTLATARRLGALATATPPTAA